MGRGWIELFVKQSLDPTSNFRQTEVTWSVHQIHVTVYLSLHVELLSNATADSDDHPVIPPRALLMPFLLLGRNDAQKRDAVSASSGVESLQDRDSVVPNTQEIMIMIENYFSCLKWVELSFRSSLDLPS